MTTTVGFEGIAINVWLVWLTPFVGAAIIAAVARVGHRARDYTAVGFALASAISAATLMPLALEGAEVHSQIPWISSLGLEAGVLADPLAIIMTNLVAWISFLIIVYSTGYMHGDKDLTRYWFLMLFFIGSISDRFIRQPAHGLLWLGRRRPGFICAYRLLVHTERKTL